MIGLVVAMETLSFWVSYVKTLNYTATTEEQLSIIESLCLLLVLPSYDRPPGQNKCRDTLLQKTKIEIIYLDFFDSFFSLYGCLIDKHQMSR